MTSILEELATATRKRVEADKRVMPTEVLRERALSLQAPPSFREALAKPGMSFICECKKASPSKGLIEPNFDYLSIAREFEEAGASAISVLTEPTRFLGDDKYLREIAEQARIPVLRKDFTVDVHMIYQAKVLGAAAVLLICSLLDDSALGRMIEACEESGLDALVEAHDEREVKRAVRAGGAIIGVNNRNLADFSVDFENSIRLRESVPEDVIFVAESGIKNARDIALLKRSGVDAVLVGEALMRAEDKKALLSEWRASA